jgi:hypothetical protein
MTQLNVGMFYTITVIDANTFSLNVDASTFSAYTSGGTWMLVASGISVQTFLNSSPSLSGNLLVGQRASQSYNQSPFYISDSDYAWQRFYATLVGQYFSVLLYYDDNLLNTYWTHTQEFELNAMNIWCRPGGKIQF